MLIIFVGNVDVSYADCTKYTKQLHSGSYDLFRQNRSLIWIDVPFIWKIEKSILPYSLEIESKTEYLNKYAVTERRR